MHGLRQQQLIAWSLVGLAILLIGAYYLRSHAFTGEQAVVTAVTLGSRDDRPTQIKVHVVGAVARPGLYETEMGARAADVIQLAGGPTPAADLSQINLAAKIGDGQQLVVPEKGAAPQAAAGAGSSPSVKTPLNLNSATVDQLVELEGVGPKTAQKIIDYREAHGGFKSVDELLEVPGIGPAKFEQIKDQVCV